MAEKRKKNLYEHFSLYTEEQINLTLTRFKKEPRSIGILKKKFGDDFLGTTSFVSFNYSENFRLETTLARFEKILKFVAKLQLNGKTNDQIKTILNEKDDVKFYKYVESLLNRNKEVPVTNFKLDKYLKIKGITKSFLADALPYHGNSNETFAFKYTYGLGVNVMDSEQIAGILNISVADVEKGVRNVIKNLDKTLDEYRKMIKELEIPQTKGRTKVRVKEAVEKPKQKKVIEVKIIGNNSRRKEFINYFATNIMTSKEKEELLIQIRKILELDKIKKLKGVQVLKSYFGENLDLVYEGSYLEQDERYQIASAVKKINDALENPNKYKNKEAKVKTKKEIKEKTFISLLKTDGLTVDEINDLKSKIIEVLNSGKYENTKVLKVFKKYFGEDYSLTYEGTYDKNERAMMAQTIRSITNSLNKPQKEKKEKKPCGRKVQEKTILSFFNLTDKTDEEIQKFKTKLIEELNSDKYKNKVSVGYLRKYFGDDFNQVCSVKYITQERLAMSQILKTITKNIDKEPKQTSMKEYFIEYLTKDASEKELEIINKNFNSIRELLEAKSPSLYKLLSNIYGTSLKEKLKQCNDVNIQTVVAIKGFVKNNCDKYKQEEFNKYNHYNGLFIRLSDYISSNLSEEEVNDRIKSFIEIKRSSSPKLINNIIDIYTITLKDNTSKNNVTASFKVGLKGFISELQEFINLDIKEYQNIIKREFKTLIEEIKGDQELKDEDILSVIEQQLLSSPQTKEILISAYGDKFDKKYRLNNFNKNETSLVKYFIQRCKDKLLNPERKRRSRNGSVIDNILGDLTNKNREEELDKLNIILASKNHEARGYILLDRLLKENIPVTSIENKKDQMNVRTYIKTIRDELATFEYINYTDTDEVIVTASPDIMDDLHSLSYLVFRFTKVYKKPAIVAEKLKISIDQILNIYLKHPNFISLETLLQYVVYNNPLYIFPVLDTQYYREVLRNLTHTEQELLYLSMIKITDEKLKNKEIQRITGLSKEDIENYQITTNCDEANRLNLYLKPSKRNK